MIIQEQKLGIVVPTAAVARDPDFYDCLEMLRKPDRYVMYRAHGRSPARNRNMGIDHCLKAGCTQILFTDDDMAFEPDALERLLRHSHLDMVMGLALRSQYPHAPAIFRRRLSRGRYEPWLLGPDDHGLKQIANGGMSFALIRTEVFRAMEPPWIRLGEFELDNWSDDTGFYERAIDAGFNLWCDFDICIGHHANMIVFPNRMGGSWSTTIMSTGGNTGVVVPAAGSQELQELLPA